MKFMKANSIAPDGMLRFAALHLRLFCLPISHKKDARLIWVKSNAIIHLELLQNSTSHEF